VKAPVARPALIVVTVVMVAAIVGLLYVGIRGQVQDNGEHRGTVTVSDCTFLSYGQHVNSYTCQGGFAGDGFTVPVVTWVNTGKADPGDRLAATVSGPDDTTAHLVVESRSRLVLTVGGAIVFAGILVALWRARLRVVRRGQVDGVG
jgi:ABC-type transporter Mla subunit MlaD